MRGLKWGANSKNCEKTFINSSLRLNKLFLIHDNNFNSEYVQFIKKVNILGIYYISCSCDSEIQWTIINCCCYQYQCCEGTDYSLQSMQEIEGDWYLIMYLESKKKWILKLTKSRMFYF